MKSKHGFTVADGFTEEEILKLEAWPTLKERTTWMFNNRDKLHELDPEWNERLTRIEQNSNPMLVANYIQDVTDNMQQWFDDLPGTDRPIKREIKIRNRIQFIDTILRPNGFPTKIENVAVENVRAELIEWRSILSDLLAGKTNQRQKNLSQAEIALICFYDKVSLEEFLQGEPSKKQKELYAEALDRTRRFGLEPSAKNHSEQANINKIARIRKIIQHLTTQNGAQQAKDEADTLQARISNDTE
jgi:hypothetical protein